MKLWENHKVKKEEFLILFNTGKFSINLGWNFLFFLLDCHSQNIKTSKIWSKQNDFYDKSV